MNIIGIVGKAGSGKDAVADILVKNHGFVRVALADPMKRFLRDVFQFSDEQLWGPSEKRNEADRRFPRKHSTAVYHGESCECCGLNLWQAHGVETQCYLTPRFALQQLGTEWGRAMSEDVSINLAMNDASQLLAGLRSFEDAEGGPMLTVPVYTPRAGLYFVPADDASLFVGRGPVCKGVVIPDVRFPDELARIRDAGGRIWRRPGESSLTSAAAAHSSETSLESVEAVDIPWYPSLDVVEAFVETILKRGL